MENKEEPKNAAHLIFAQNIKVCPDLPILQFLNTVKKRGWWPMFKKSLISFVKYATNNEKKDFLTMLKKCSIGEMGHF